MQKPLLNASLAALYIIGIVLAINALTSRTELQKTVLIPIVMLSLFVLSAAIMGFLFGCNPFQLYFDGHKKEAVVFFLKTVGFFAAFAALFAGALLYTSLF